MTIWDDCHHPLGTWEERVRAATWREVIDGLQAFRAESGGRLVHGNRVLEMIAAGRARPASKEEEISFRAFKEWLRRTRGKSFPNEPVPAWVRMSARRALRPEGRP